jgi:TPR repeat protein
MNKGSGLAMYNYFIQYASGLDGPLEYTKLIKLEKEASERGSANAMGTLALAANAALNNGLPKEWLDLLLQQYPPKSTLVNYAKVSAMRGVKDGQTALGNLYLFGSGVPKNIDLAENYLTLASKAGDIRADAMLITIYEEEKIDIEKASKLKEKYKNNSKAIEAIGLLSANYYCQPENSQEKIRKCFELIKEGRGRTVQSPAIYGYLLVNGYGTQKDPIEGMAWVLHQKNNTNRREFY